MSGLFVKLDAEYASDDKLIAAGPLAELIHIRALAFCKRQPSDGLIKLNQLPVVALGIPSPRKHVDRLVEFGAWVEIDGGWFITSWFKWNKSVEQITDDKEARRMASVEANHAQHHVGPDKKPSPKCELCRPQKPPPSAPKSAPKSEANRSVNRLQEEEPEPEPEEQPKPEEEEEPTSGKSVRRNVTTGPTLAVVTGSMFKEQEAS